MHEKGKIHCIQAYRTESCEVFSRGTYLGIMLTRLTVYLWYTTLSDPLWVAGFPKVLCKTMFKYNTDVQVSNIIDILRI